MSAPKVVAIAGLLLLPARVATAQQQTFAVSGRVVTSSGEPLRGRDHFILIGHDEANGFRSTTARLEEDGSFHCELAPGRYLVSAGPLPEPSGITPEGERGFAAVTVSHADVQSVVVRTLPPVRVRGRVRFEDQRPGTSLPTINVFATAAFDGIGVSGAEPQARVAADGTFELVAAAAPVVIRYGLSGDSPWWSGPILLDGEDITDVPTDFSKVHGELVVVLTQRPIGVFGIVTEDSTQLPAEEASVVIFSAEPAQRQPWANATKLLQADGNGRFWGTLSEGKYFAVAFPSGTFSGPAEALRDLATYEKLATAFTIDPERRGARVHLTLSRPPILKR